MQRRRSGSSTASVRFRPNCTHSAANGLNTSLPTVRANTESVSMREIQRKRSDETACLLMHDAYKIWKMLDHCFYLVPVSAEPSSPLLCPSGIPSDSQLLEESKALASPWLR